MNCKNYLVGMLAAVPSESNSGWRWNGKDCLVRGGANDQSRPEPRAQFLRTPGVDPSESSLGSLWNAMDGLVVGDANDQSRPESWDPFGN
jgi:hypothetical protein